VRIGFENNLHLPDGSIARDNAQLIDAYRTAAVEYGRRPATADEIRNECLN
jgi:3-keto-5-aminohexanoate cleavage enzyme